LQIIGLLHDSLLKIALYVLAVARPYLVWF